MCIRDRVWTTSRDLARLGLLYLNDGVWEGERLLPEGWSGYVSAPLGAQPPNRLGKKAEEPGRVMERSFGVMKITTMSRRVPMPLWAIADSF